MIEELIQFRDKEKFADSEWTKRGLNPSDSELCFKMEILLNNCVGSLITSTMGNNNQKIFKKLIKKGLKRFNKLDYDTEEREFICDYFFELSQIIDVDIRIELNNWLYGFALGSIIRMISALRKPYKTIETLSQDCTGCSSPLETFIFEREANISDSNYDIVRCKTCEEFNLIDRGCGIKRFKIGNYDTIEELSKDEYNDKQAKIRLEQIKYFRK